MEPVTHALAAVAVARAGLNRTTRLATPMAFVAGLAADVDVVSLAGGAPAYLAYNRTVTHSLVGSGVLAASCAAVFWLLGRKHASRPVRFLPALVVSLAAATVHLLLDISNSYGVQLLWPFRKTWYAWDLLDVVDPWLLLVLVAGLLLPGLFRMVSEEIGARPASRGTERWAVATLAVVLLYCGGRFLLHGRALQTLNSRMYHGAVAEKAGAFPWSVSPFAWHGVVATDNTLEEVEVPVGPGAYFDPDRGRTHFKPESSPALAAAQKTAAVREFTRFARFPIASVQRMPAGYQVMVRDLRFPESQRTGRAVIAVVELDHNARVTREAIEFGLRVRD